MTAIVTGANRGLGYQTTRILAADISKTIVLAGRDFAGTTEAAKRIHNETGNANLVPMQLDLASIDAVRSFTSEYRRLELPPLECIICNAGISKTTIRDVSADGYEETFAVNHLGHFLLTHLLLDLLQAPARIIFVSSGTHDPSSANGPMQPPRFVKAEWLAYPELDPETPGDEPTAGGRAYASSKLCNVLCTYEFERRLRAAGLSSGDRSITVCAFDPGFMPGTELGRDSKGFVRFAWYRILPLISRLMSFGRTPGRSGEDLAYLATTPELAEVTGAYFSGPERMESSPDSHDPAKAADLWDTSVTLSRLARGESPLLI